MDLDLLEVNHILRGWLPDARLSPEVLSMFEEGERGLGLPHCCELGKPSNQGGWRTDNQGGL